MVVRVWKRSGSLWQPSDGEHGVDLAGAGRAEVWRDDLGPAVVVAPAEGAQHHGGVVHEAFAVALGGVLGQHLAEGFPVALFPHLHHAAVQRFEEGAPDPEGVVGREAVLREPVAERAAGEECDGAVVVVFHGLAHGPAEAGAVVEVMRLAQRGNRDGLEVPVGVHVAHGHEGAVLGAEGGGVVGQGFDAMLVAHLRQQLAQGGVAGDLELHVADEVGQFVAGVGSLEVGRTVEVVAGVDEPVGVEHDDGVDTECAAAAADFLVAVDGVLPRSLAWSVEFAEVHRGDVGDLRHEC
jgi:hypothetical protein